MTTPSVEALLFDFDGTVIDTEWPVFRSIQIELETAGLELPLEVWQATLGTDQTYDWVAALHSHCGDDFDETATQQSRRARRDALLHAEDLRPGIEHALDEATRREMACAVASSSPRSWVEGHLRRIDLWHRFDAVRTRDDVERAKPAPDLFLAAAAALGVEPAACVALEDSANGAAAARAAGVRVIVAPNRLTVGGDFSAADLVVDSLADAAVAEFLGW